MVVEKGFLLVGGCLGSMNRGKDPDERKHFEVGASWLRDLNISETIE